MRFLSSAILAIVSGLVAVVTASLSLSSPQGMPVMPPMTRPDPLPAYLLLSFGLLLLINGTILVLGVRVSPRGQGGAMVIYGLLMAIVGTGMIFGDFFLMSSLDNVDMSTISALAMYALGGLMVLFGAAMLVRPSMSNA